MPNPSVYIIAEAGVNHNGSLDLAKRLIETAATAGADAVKFQTFTAKSLVTRTSPKAKYQQTENSHETQFEMLQRLELNADMHLTLKEHAAASGIQFLSTGFDRESVQLLQKLDLPIFKIPSGEITNYPLLRQIAGLGKPSILSTGMATLSEIADCLEVLEIHGLPRTDITILHCNTQYPTPMNDVNLLAMRTIASTFPEVQVGYSDHTLGIEAPIAAVALGAKVIEKHFTLDRSMAGPDHAASLEPDELSQMVSAIRNIERALGSEQKQPTPSETPNIPIARKSIVAATHIQTGETFTEQNLTTKRPGSGRSPMDWPTLIGSTAKRDYETDELID